MTILEAWEQALREVGMTEEDIQRRHAAASMAVPITKDILGELIPPEKEREAVEALKNLYGIMRANRELLEPIYQQMMAKQSEKN